MSKTPLLYDDLETSPRRHLFSFAGVPFTATHNAWLGVLSHIGICIIVALVTLPDRDISTRLLYGVIFGILFDLTYFTHDIGHILSGLYVKSPMDECFITSTRHMDIYRGPQDGLPSRVHLGRSLGGPLANLLLGILALILWLVLGGPALLFLALLNLIFGAGSFLPLPSIDGEVIWRELRAK